MEGDRAREAGGCEERIAEGDRKVDDAREQAWKRIRREENEKMRE